jgi:Protein of unknown function (DUF4054)
MTTPAGVVAFDWMYFATVRYPELASIGIALGQAYFNEAQLYCDNTPASPVADSTVGGQRYLFLHMITAHIAALNAPVATAQGTSPASPLVGRISNATEGSVSVQTEFTVPDGTPQFWAQTKYGVAFWVASVQYRQMFYVPGPRRNFEPYPFGRIGSAGVNPVNP